MTAVTPYRKTHIRLDFPEYTLREPPFALYRDAHQIAQGHEGQAKSNHWHYLETGAIVCQPWNDDPSNLHEKTDTKGAILPLSMFSAIPGVVERNTFRAPTDLTGVTTDASVQATGDPFMQKTTAAGTSWDKSLTPDITAWGQITTGNNVQFQRVLVGNAPQPANQAYLLRIVLPEGSPANTQLVCGFYFGGPTTTTEDGTPSGKFCLEIQANGKAILHVWHIGTSAFVPISTWPAFTRATATEVVFCRIWPHYTANGTPAIHFWTDAGSGGGARGGAFQTYFKTQISSDVHVWYGWNPQRVSPGAYPPLPVTGPAAPRVDIPIDKRPAVQISVLRHLDVAVIQDDDFSLDFFRQPTGDMGFYWNAYVPDGTTFLAQLFDASTDVELTPSMTMPASGPGFKLYSINALQPTYYAKFTMTPSTDCKTTPIFYNYKVQMSPVSRLNDPGEVDI